MQAPILNRECYYEKLRDGTFVFLDWNLVNTSLGAMVEPRNLGTTVGNPGNSGAVRYMLQESFSRMVEMDSNKLPSLIGTAGNQLPKDFTT